MEIHRIDPRTLRKIASNIEYDEFKYRYIKKHNQMLLEHDAEMLSVPIIREVQLIAKFGEIYSLKIRLNRNMPQNNSILSDLLNWIACLGKLRSLFIKGLADYLDRLGRLLYREDGLYLDKTLFPRKDFGKKLLLFSKLIIRNLLKKSEALNYIEILYFFHFFNEHEDIRVHLASNPNAPLYTEYAKLFTDSSREVRQAIAGIPNAPLYKEYAILFTDSSWKVRRAVAGNPNAKIHQDYSWLIEKDGKSVYHIIKDPTSVLHTRFQELFTDSSSDVRQAVAGNPNAPMYKEYARLFTDSSVGVRLAVAGNPNAPMYKEYARLFTDTSDYMRLASN